MEDPPTVVEVIEKDDQVENDSPARATSQNDSEIPAPHQRSDDDDDVEQRKENPDILAEIEENESPAKTSHSPAKIWSQNDDDLSSPHQPTAAAADDDDDVVEQRTENQDVSVEIDISAEIPKSIKDYVETCLKQQQKQVGDLEKRLALVENKLIFVQAENARFIKRVDGTFEASNGDLGESNAIPKDQRKPAPAATTSNGQANSQVVGRKHNTATRIDGATIILQNGKNIDEGAPPSTTYDIAWNSHFQNLQHFKAKYGHFNVYRGYSRVLCEWVSRQRRVLLGKKKGVMNAPRQDALRRIGFSAVSEDEECKVNLSISMEEEESDAQVDLSAYPKGIPAGDYLDRQWNERYLSLRDFRREYGHCRVPPGFNKTLSSWVVYQRQLYNGNKRGNQGETIGMDATRIAALTSVGMNWKHSHRGFKRRKWDSDDSDVDEPQVPAILSQKRLKSSPQPPLVKEELDMKEVPSDEERKVKKESAGEKPQPSALSQRPDEKFWEEKLRRLKRFKAKKGHFHVTVFNDRTLFIWMNRQRQQYRSKGGLRRDRIDALNAIGFDWKDSNARRANHSSDEDDDDDDDEELAAVTAEQDAPVAEEQDTPVIVEQDTPVTVEQDTPVTVEQDYSESPNNVATEVVAAKMEEDSSSTEDVFSDGNEDGKVPAITTAASVITTTTTATPTKEIFELDKGVPESNPRDRIWNLHFQNLQRFKKEHGSFRVSKAIDTVLQEWVSRQRLVYNGKKHGDLNQERRKALKRIGFRLGD